MTELLRMCTPERSREQRGCAAESLVWTWLVVMCHNGAGDSSRAAIERPDVLTCGTLADHSAGCLSQATPAEVNATTETNNSIRRWTTHYHVPYSIRGSCQGLISRRRLNFLGH